jgi:hypothetical protein
MDAKSLAEQILGVLRKNGYPERRVRLPYHQIYRSAVDNGFALAESLDILKRLYRVDSERVEDRVLFFPFITHPPQCDSKRVDKGIRQTIRPLLKNAGFNKNRGRNSWRSHDNASCVINFQSFNSYHAELYGCTTFSLAVNAGIFLRDTMTCPWVSDPVPEFPKEYECHVRMSPHKPLGYVDNCTYKNIWHIDPDGSNIDEAVASIADALTESVLPWLDRHLDPDLLLDRFLNDVDTDETEVFFGMPHSPARATVVCGILISRGDITGARKYLEDSLSVDSSSGTRSLQQEYLELFNAQFPKS